MRRRTPGFFIVLEGPDLSGKSTQAARLVASPLKLSGTPVRAPVHPPILGEHTIEILTEVLKWQPSKARAYAERIKAKG